MQSTYVLESDCKINITQIKNSNWDVILINSSATGQAYIYCLNFWNI